MNDLPAFKICKKCSQPTTHPRYYRAEPHCRRCYKEVASNNG